MTKENKYLMKIGIVIFYVLALALILIRFSNWPLYAIIINLVAISLFIFFFVFKSRYKFISFALFGFFMLAMNILPYTSSGSYYLNISYPTKGIDANLDWSGTKDTWLIELLKNKTVVVPQNTKYKLVVDLFAKEVRYLSDPIPEISPKEAPKTEYLLSSMLLSYQYNTGTDLQEENLFESRVPFYIWPDGLEDADTIVLLEDNEYSLFVMSWDEYCNLKGNR